MATTKKTTTKKATTKKATTKKATTKKATTKKATTKKATAAKEFSSRTVKAFHNRIKDGDVDKVAADIARGMPLDDCFDINGYGSKGETPLGRALKSKQYAVAKLLLEAGADVNTKGEYDYAPLHHPSDPETAELLIAKGARLDARNAAGQTPLHCAARRKDIDCARVLLAHGAEIDAEDKSGQTPFEGTFHVPTRDFLISQGSVGLRKSGGHALTPASVEAAELTDVDVNRGCMGVDAEGNVWFAAYGGLFRYDGAQVQRYRFDASFAFGGFARGKGKSVFFSTNWGLFETDVDASHFRMHDATDSGLHDNHITTIAGSPNGDVYLACYEDESDEGKYVSKYDGERWQLLRPGVDLPVVKRIEHITVSEGGELLISVRKGFAEKRDGVWQTVTDFGDDNIFPPSVYDIVVDGRTTYFGTQRGVYRRRKGEYKFFRTENLAKHLCLHGETLWIGTSFGGVVRFDLPSGEMTTFKTDNSALQHDDISGLHVAPGGTIWVHANNHVARIRDGVIEPVTRAS